VAETSSWIREDVAQFFHPDPLDRAWALQGERVRAVARRETLRVVLDGRIFYLKRHRGVGWAEVLKNWLVLKRPVVGARNEFEACRHLARAGVTAPRVAAFADSGGPPASRTSFVLCDALVGYEDLEEITDRWHEQRPEPREIRRLLLRVAAFARRFHGAGVVHRDFYLCHLLKNPEEETLGVLDLHRALIFDEAPRRWRERDLAALLYSSLDLGLSPLSWLRFVRIYGGRPLVEEFRDNGAFWRRVHRRALALYRKGTRKGLTRGLFTP
jgi:heptose I phosphotransferase